MELRLVVGTELRLSLCNSYKVLEEFSDVYSAQKLKLKLHIHKEIMLLKFETPCLFERVIKC